MADEPFDGRRVKKLIIAGRFLAGAFSKWNCERCESVEQVSEKQGSELKRRQGCTSDAPRPLADNIPGYGPLYRCPIVLLTGDDYLALRVYPHYVDGRLGPITELPGVLVDAMEILQRTVRQVDAETRGN